MKARMGKIGDLQNKRINQKQMKMGLGWVNRAKRVNAAKPYDSHGGHHPPACPIRGVALTSLTTLGSQESSVVSQVGLEVEPL